MSTPIPLHDSGRFLRPSGTPAIGMHQLALEDRAGAFGIARLASIQSAIMAKGFGVFTLVGFSSIRRVAHRCRLWIGLTNHISGFGGFAQQGIGKWRSSQTDSSERRWLLLEIWSAMASSLRIVIGPAKTRMLHRCECLA